MIQEVSDNASLRYSLNLILPTHRGVFIPGFSNIYPYELDVNFYHSFV